AGRPGGGPPPRARNASQSSELLGTPCRYSGTLAPAPLDLAALISAALGPAALVLAALAGAAFDSAALACAAPVALGSPARAPPSFPAPAWADALRQKTGSPS